MSKHPSLTTHPSRAQVLSDRTEHKRVLVIHTGKVTEVEIFKKLKQDLPNGVLVSVFEKNIPDAIQRAVKEAKKAAREGDAYDHVFIVADVDNLPINDLRTWRDGIDNLDFPADLILSNPCIEVWLSCYAAPVTGESVTIAGAQEEAHDKEFTYGKKNKYVHVEKLSDYLKAAKEAKRIKQQYCDRGDVLSGAPATDFYKIIAVLEKELKSLQ